MALNRLQNYNWEQGTLTNPVNLSGEEMSGLIELALRSSINSDVRGYIHPISSISSYQEWVLNTKYPNLVLVNATIVDTEYSVLFENNATTAYINEGNRIKLVPLNIGLGALKFRIYSHAITTDNVASEETIRGRVSIDAENGYVVVGAAQENSSWSDTVVIQALPVYQEWDDGVHIPKELTLSISAVKVTSATIIVPSVAKPSTAISGNITLSQHTKPIITGGSNTGNGVFVVPKIGDTVLGTGSDGLSFSLITPTEGTYAISCDVYLFSTSVIGLTATPVNIVIKYPYIQFTVTTDGTFSDISSANPKITLQKVDSEDTPIGEPIVLAGTVSGSSLVYTYGNGNVAGDGSETYKVTFDEAPEGYKNIQNVFITPNQPLTEVAVQYVVNKPDLYFVYGDGDYEPLSAIETRGRVKSGKTRIGIAIVTENTSFILSTASEHKPTSRDYSGYGDRFLRGLNGYSIPVDTATKTQSRIDAVEDFRGQENTLAVYSANIEAFTQGNADGRFFAIPQTTVEINNVQYNGFIPSLGQLEIIAQNASIINNFINTYIGIQNYFNGLPTSTLTNQGYVSSTRYNNYNFWLYNPHHSTNPHEQNTPQTNVSLFIITCFPFNI